MAHSSSKPTGKGFEKTAGGVLAPLHLANGDPIVLAPNGQIVMSDARQQEAEMIAKALVTSQQVRSAEAREACAVAIGAMGPYMQQLQVGALQPEALTHEDNAGQTRTIMAEIQVGDYAVAIQVQAVARHISTFQPNPPPVDNEHVAEGCERFNDPALTAGDQGAS